MEPLYTVKEVAGILKCSRDVVSGLIVAGKIKAIDLADPKSKHRNFRITQAAVDAFIAGDWKEDSKPKLPASRLSSGKTRLRHVD